MKLKKRSGVSLIEILTSVSILSVVVIGVTSMQSTFTKTTNHRVLANHLMDTAQSQMMQCKLGQAVSPELEVSIGNTKKDIYVTSKKSDGTNYDCSIPVAVNSCVEVIIKVSDNASPTAISNSYSVRTTMCNFE